MSWGGGLFADSNKLIYVRSLCCSIKYYTGILSYNIYSYTCTLSSQCFCIENNVCASQLNNSNKTAAVWNVGTRGEVKCSRCKVGGMRRVITPTPPPARARAVRHCTLPSLRRRRQRQRLWIYSSTFTFNIMFAKSHFKLELTQESMVHSVTGLLIGCEGSALVLLYVDQTVLVCYRI